MIDPQLTKVLNYLQGAQILIASGTFGATGRPWLNFSEIQVVGKFDYAGLHQIFNRNASNDEYGSLRAAPESKAKNLQTAKLSGDYLAGLERDYRMRQRTRIRCIVHAGNRSAANGSGQGPLRRNSTGWMSRILAEEAT